MATETTEKEQAQPEQAGEVQPEAKPEQTPEKPEKKEKKEILLPILTFLFLLVGVGELILWGITGFGVFQGAQARKAYEARQASLQTGETAPPAGASYRGPGLIVENGTVTWRRSDELASGASFSGSTSSIQGVGGTGQGDGTGGSIPRGLWLPYPPPPWAREVPSDSSGQDTPAQSEPVQT